jgi:hypothetical protein
MDYARDLLMLRRGSVTDGMRFSGTRTRTRPRVAA